MLHLPDMAGRYCSVQLTDPWTGALVGAVGTRTTGNGAADVLLVSPGLRSTAPKGIRPIRLPHRTALVLGRVFVSDAEDRAAAAALARRIELRPVLP